jgi:acetyl-CoA acyltransferase 2
METSCKLQQYNCFISLLKDAAYLARHVGLRCKLPITVPALTINRLCGSGFQALINGIQEIQLSNANIVLTGGTENMSQAPYAVRNIRFGTRYGVDQKMEDNLAHALIDRYPQETPMAITAENLGNQNGITRELCDAYALQSQKRWAAANEAGVFKSEIAPIVIKTKKGTEEMNAGYSFIVSNSR